jgi:hypothetical protein
MAAMPLAPQANPGRLMGVVNEELEYPDSPIKKDEIRK